MATSVGSSVLSPGRGAPEPSRAAPRRSLRAVPARGRSRRGELPGAIVLAVAWVLLWAFFVVAIVEQAAALRSAATGAAPAHATPAPRVQR